MKDEDLAYIAGPFDGEGSVSICRRKSSRSSFLLEVRISNTHLPALEWVRKSIGFGYINKSGGIVYPRRKQCFNYKATSRMAAIFLRLVRPWLKIKAEQADLAIAFQESYRRNGGQPISDAEFGRREAERQRLLGMRRRVA